MRLPLKRRILIGLFLGGALVGCQTVPPPMEEYALARAAMDSARAVQASKFSQGSWNQAEDSYRKAKVYFKESDWARSKEEFIKAMKAAEKAENSARMIRQKTGDIL